MLSPMFVQLDIHYYVDITSFREVQYIYVVSGTEPDEPLKCLHFSSCTGCGNWFHWIYPLWGFLFCFVSIVNWFWRS